MAGNEREGMKREDLIEVVHDGKENNLETGRNMRGATMTRVPKDQRGLEVGGGRVLGEVGRKIYY